MSGVWAARETGFDVRRWPRGVADGKAREARATFPVAERGSLDLRDCVGFTASGKRSRRGVVEDIVVDEHGEPDALLLAGGTFTLRRWLVPVRDVAAVQPRRRRVGLRANARCTPA